MVEVLQSIVALVVTLSILVTFHEFGHYWVARKFNVHVLRFSLGFGRVLYSRRGKVPDHPPPPSGSDVMTRSNEPVEGTEFAISAIPLGGYVKMLDEREGYVPDDMRHLAFNRKPVWQRILIVAAGPIANFLLAIVAYWFLYTVGVTGVVPRLGDIEPGTPAANAGLVSGQEIVAVDGVPTRTWSDVNMQLFERIGDTGVLVLDATSPGSTEPVSYRLPISSWMSSEEEPYPAGELGLALWYPEIPARIGGVMAGEAAEAAGFKVGDEVTRIDGEVVKDWAQLVRTVQEHPGETLSFEVERDGRTVMLTAAPKDVERDGKHVGYLGASRTSVEMPADMQRVVRYPFYSAWIQAMEKTWSVTVFTLESIQKMIVGAISHKNLSGPITIAQVASATAQSGFESFIGFIALLSISLGVLNLLPIPVLDGGHLLYYTIELVTGRPVPERIQVWGLQMGMFLIVSIMLLAFYNDLMRLS
ncbi:MAG: RIP metalloprotease RseP [Pseudomonadales bacterium]|nr:RIP metalloprotease RseP [Pseudomonadales bacterium]